MFLVLIPGNETGMFLVLCLPIFGDETGVFLVLCLPIFGDETGMFLVLIPGNETGMFLVLIPGNETGMFLVLCVPIPGNETGVFLTFYLPPLLTISSKCKSINFNMSASFPQTGEGLRSHMCNCFLLDYHYRTNQELVRFLRVHRGSNFVKTHGGDINKYVAGIRNGATTWDEQCAVKPACV